MSASITAIFCLKPALQINISFLQYLTIIRRRRSDYWCISINTQVIISKNRKKKTLQHEIMFTYSGKTTTGSNFVRRGDYRLIIRDSEPMRARNFV